MSHQLHKAGNSTRTLPCYPDIASSTDIYVLTYCTLASSGTASGNPLSRQSRSRRSSNAYRQRQTANRFRSRKSQFDDFCNLNLTLPLRSRFILFCVRFLSNKQRWQCSVVDKPIALSQITNEFTNEILLCFDHGVFSLMYTLIFFKYKE